MSNQELFAQGGAGLVSQPIAMINMQGSKSNAVAQKDGPSYTLNAMHGHDVHVIAQPIGFDAYNQCLTGDVSISITSAASDISHVGGVLTNYAVRRLTPIECERLQGFPDNYTAIPWRGKEASQCPDGPRYKALGNSMAVPVMRWIGERIQAVEELMKEIKQ